MRCIFEIRQRRNVSYVVVHSRCIELDMHCIIIVVMPFVWMMVGVAQCYFDIDVWLHTKYASPLPPIHWMRSTILTTQLPCSIAHTSQDIPKWHFVTIIAWHFEDYIKSNDLFVIYLVKICANGLISIYKISTDCVEIEKIIKNLLRIEWAPGWTPVCYDMLLVLLRYSFYLDLPTALQ